MSEDAKTSVVQKILKGYICIYKQTHTDCRCGYKFVLYHDEILEYFVGAKTIILKVI